MVSEGAFFPASNTISIAPLLASRCREDGPHIDVQRDQRIGHWVEAWRMLATIPFTPSPSVPAYSPVSRSYSRDVTQSPVRYHRHSTSPSSSLPRTTGRSGDRCGGSASVHACSWRNRNNSRVRIPGTDGGGPGHRPASNI